MKDFFEQNTWASFLVLGMIVISVMLMYLSKVKSTMKTLDENNTFNVLKNKSSRKWTNFLSVLSIFVIFSLFSYFILTPVFAVQTNENTKEQITTDKNLLTQPTQSIDDFFGNLFERINNTPALAGLVIAGIGLFMLIAVILDADWMLEGGNGFFNIATISRMFGRKIARIIIAIPCILLIIAGLGIAWGYS